MMQGYSRCFHLPLRRSLQRCRSAGRWRELLEFRRWDADPQLNFPCRRPPTWTATRRTRRGSSCTLLQETSSYLPASALSSFQSEECFQIYGLWYRNHHFAQCLNQNQHIYQYHITENRYHPRIFTNTNTANNSPFSNLSRRHHHTRIGVIVEYWTKTDNRYCFCFVPVLLVQCRSVGPCAS